RAGARRYRGSSRWLYSCREHQTVASPRLTHKARRQLAGRQVTSQPHDIRPELLGGELRRSPGLVHQLLRGVELTGSLREKGEKLGLAPGQTQTVAGMAEQPAPDVEVQAGELPEALFPELQP